MAELPAATAELVEPRLEELAGRLAALAAAQERVRGELRDDTARLQSTAEARATVEAAATKAAAYAAKAAALRREMAALRERTDRLARRSAALQQKKQRVDAQLIESERRLLAKDATAADRKP